MTNEILQSIMQIVRACESVQLCTYGENYPETRHLTNAMNRDAVRPPLYFMTGRDTPKYMQLQKNPKCCVYYYDDATHHSVRLFGVVEFVTDAATRKKYWRDEYLQFGYAGPESPDFILMRFVPHEYKFYVGADIKTGKMD